MQIKKAVDDDESQREEDPTQCMPVAPPPWPLQSLLVELELDVASVEERRVEDVGVWNV